MELLDKECSIGKKGYSNVGKRFYRSDSLLMLAAIIWGSAFVAQRVGMNYVGPLTFNGVRFALGAIVLLPWQAGSSWARCYPYGA